jgi:hypothetical protein
MAREPINPDQNPLDDIWQNAEDDETLIEMSPSDVLRYIRDAKFPADRRQLMARACHNDAPDGVVAVLHALADRRYGSLADVASQIAGHD